MSRTSPAEPHAPGFFALLGCVALLALGCGFDPEPAQEEEDNDRVGEATGQDETDEINEDQGGGTGVTSVEELDDRDDLTSTSAPESTDPTSTGAPEPALDPIEDYCSLGSQSCYMMDKLVEGSLLDQGDLGLNIAARDLQIVQAKAPGYPFGFAAKLPKIPRPETTKSFELPDQGIIGFDVWIRPSSPESVDWNAVGIEGFLSLRRIRQDSRLMLQCNYNVSLNPTFPAIPKEQFIDFELDFPPDAFVHVACGYDGKNVSLWVNGTEHQSASHDRPMIPASSTYILNWNSIYHNPFQGQLGPLRIWHDVDLMRERMDELYVAVMARAEPGR